MKAPTALNETPYAQNLEAQLPSRKLQHQK
jgi:hypothetical protein